MTEKYKPSEEEVELTENDFRKKEASRAEFTELVNREQEKLREFFGYDIEAPPLPDEITPEKYEQWKELGFELHYLPKEDMTKKRNLPGWQKKPNFVIYNAIGERKISPDSTKLSSAWILVDGREKPQYDNGKQMYENDDEIGNALKKLRKQGLIQNHEIADSRFNISWDELNKGEVKKALAEILGIDPDNLRLPRAIEWNYLGNAFHKEWGETNTWEWFEDEYGENECFGERQQRLNGGHSDDGGLSSVHADVPGIHYPQIGFRLLVDFSSLK